jgi:hypothetical protein
MQIRAISPPGRQHSWPDLLQAAPQNKGAAFVFCVSKPVEKLGECGEFMGTKLGYSTASLEVLFGCGKVPFFSTGSTQGLRLSSTAIATFSQVVRHEIQTSYNVFHCLYPQQTRPYTVTTVLINQSFNKKDQK